MSPNRSDHRVLIIASDTLLAALVGALVEATGLSAAYPQPSERPDDALARVKPLAAVLVDGEADIAASDVFLMRARKRRVTVMLFGSAATIGRLAELARASEIPAFRLPEDLDELRKALERVPESTHSSDRRARTERTAEGQLQFIDERGQRWSVYDRRSQDRRHPVHRRFVNAAGEILGCDLDPGEESENSAEALQEQLAHAKPE